jgi:two-component system sensor histidine kinase CiaH
MFRTARLKLTAWYVFIIMLVSICFSIVMYSMLVQEVQRAVRTQRFRFERRLEQDRVLITPEQLTEPFSQQLSPDIENEIIHNIQIQLLLVNAGILVVSAGFSYLLAGKTLHPIQSMVEEQHRFISDASHELRTPLTALRTTFEVALREQNLTLKEAKELIKENLEEIDNLQALSGALLKLSSYQNKANDQHFQPLQLEDVAQAAIKKITPLANKKKISIKTETTPVTIEGSTQQLTELVIILLDNAIKYSSKNKTIIVSLTHNQKWARLSFIDQGVGIPTEDLNHIFDRFYRTDKSRSRSQIAGYGLGLSIAQHIAQLHKGKIEVESALGEGSVFSVFLPVKSS